MKRVESPKPNRQECAMHIAYHIGAHCTDEGRLFDTLRKNDAALSEQGVFIPGPGKYRNLLRETIQGLKGELPEPGTRDVLLRMIMDKREPERLVLSNELFICVVKRIFENQLFYHLIDEKVGGMRALFPEDEISYYLAMRNPATFIPAVYEKQSDMDLHSFLRGVDPRHIRWSAAIERLQRADPQAEITVWSDEDTPLFWARLVRAITGVDAMTRITGGFDQLQHVISADGMDHFVAYLRQKPPQTEAQKLRIIVKFLERFGLPDITEAEIDLPGWDQDLVDQITDGYHDDLERIRKMNDVTLISA